MTQPGDGKRIAEIARYFTWVEPETHDTMKGGCPFCTLDLPMFRISLTKGLWHCFGCCRGGDLQAFIRELKEN